MMRIFQERKGFRATILRINSTYNTYKLFLEQIYQQKNKSKEKTVFICRHWPSYIIPVDHDQLIPVKIHQIRNSFQLFDASAFRGVLDFLEAHLEQPLSTPISKKIVKNSIQFQKLHINFVTTTELKFGEISELHKIR